MRRTVLNLPRYYSTHLTVNYLSHFAYCARIRTIIYSGTMFP